MLLMTEPYLFLMQALTPRPCPLHTDVSSNSQNLFILYSVDDDILKLFYIIQKLFHNLWMQVVKPLPSFTSEKLCLSKKLSLYPVMLLNSYQ